MARLARKLVCFSYHKSGTSLLLHVMTKVSRALGLSLANHYGLVGRIDLDADIILLPHSLLAAPLEQPYRAIRMVRDPRDIWVSGYLYHLRCEEAWCRNTDFDLTAPIAWPRVDYSVAHRPEDWKRRYLQSLGGRSYQQTLLALPLEEGLAFELQNYTGWTLEAMRAWSRSGVDALDLQLEAVMTDFDGSMGRIFAHFGFTPEQTAVALDVARSEDIRRMSDAAIAERPQIYSRRISKWREVLTTAQVIRFKDLHGGLIRELGYGLASGDPGFARDATESGQVWLEADGARINPTVVRAGQLTFVVPPGRKTVWLKTAPPAGNCADRPGAAGPDDHRKGLRIGRLVIRSGEIDTVFAADDPRLTTGWHEPERAGDMIWRWTDEAALLPWPGGPGPMIVTVHQMDHSVGSPGLVRG
jgi:hypothetical protein